eukprot:2057982-Amphidinium_carterae.1
MVVSEVCAKTLNRILSGHWEASSHSGYRNEHRERERSAQGCLLIVLHFFCELAVSCVSQPVEVAVLMQSWSACRRSCTQIYCIWVSRLLQHNALWAWSS